MNPESRIGNTTIIFIHFIETVLQLKCLNLVIIYSQPHNEHPGLKKLNKNNKICNVFALRTNTEAFFHPGYITLPMQAKIFLKWSQCIEQNSIGSNHQKVDIGDSYNPLKNYNIITNPKELSSTRPFSETLLLNLKDWESNYISDTGRVGQEHH